MGEYPGGRTPWENYQVPELAGFLAEDLGPAWQHVRAWYGTAGVAATYQQALQRIHDGLAAAWPPQRSPAATLFLSRLKSMIDSLADVHEAAANNGGALTGVLETLEGARRQVDQVHEQWRQFGTPYESEYSTGADAWRGALDEQAQRIMHDTDDAVFAYQSRMQEPKAWNPPSDWGPSSKDGSPDGSGDDAGTGGAGSATGGRSLQPPQIPSVTPLDNSGASAPSTATTRSLGAGAVLTGGLASEDPAGSPIGPTDGAVRARPAAESGAAGSWMVDTPRGRVLGVGGVIGIPPTRTSGLPDGTTGAQPGRVAPASFPAARTSGSSGTPVEAGERGTGGLVGGPAAMGLRSDGSRRRPAPEPYVQWEVRKGVPPVIEPGPEPRHDPGPGVIGLDR